MILTLVFSNFRAFESAEFPLFFATGVLPFQIFQKSSIYIANSFTQNRPLLNYPRVKRIDTAIARMMLEFVTGTIVIILVFSFQVFVLGFSGPNNVFGLFQFGVVMLVLGFGVGLCLAVIQTQIPTVLTFYGLVVGPSFFFSAVFYSVQSVPTHLREILLWNPLIHGIESFRASYFNGYRTAGIDLEYLFWWIFILIFLGLLMERHVRRVAN